MRVSSALRFNDDITIYMDWFGCEIWKCASAPDIVGKLLHYAWLREGHLKPSRFAIHASGRRDIGHAKAKQRAGVSACSAHADKSAWTNSHTRMDKRHGRCLELRSRRNGNREITTRQSLLCHAVLLVCHIVKALLLV